MCSYFTGEIFIINNINIYSPYHWLASCVKGLFLMLQSFARLAGLQYIEDIIFTNIL